MTTLTTNTQTSGCETPNVTFAKVARQIAKRLDLPDAQIPTFAEIQEYGEAPMPEKSAEIGFPPDSRDFFGFLLHHCSRYANSAQIREAVFRVNATKITDHLHFLQEYGDALWRLNGHPTAAEFSESLELHTALQKRFDLLQIDADFRFPGAAILEQWLLEKNAKDVSRDFDGVHPVAILKRETMGSVRDVVIDNGTARVKAVNRDVPQSNQLLLPGTDTPKVLPQVLPFHAVGRNFKDFTTKSGAVAMPIRLFFEALMALGPRETQAMLRLSLGDITD